MIYVTIVNKWDVTVGVTADVTAKPTVRTCIVRTKVRSETGGLKQMQLCAVCNLTPCNQVSIPA
jgi:hypothetical protein